MRIANGSRVRVTVYGVERTGVIDKRTQPESTIVWVRMDDTGKINWFHPESLSILPNPFLPHSLRIEDCEAPTSHPVPIFDPRKRYAVDALGNLWIRGDKGMTITTFQVNAMTGAIGLVPYDQRTDVSDEVARAHFTQRS